MTTDPKRPRGRPPSVDGPAPRTSVRIPVRLLARLDEAARDRGLSRSRALVGAIRAWLGELEPEEKKNPRDP